MWQNLLKCIFENAACTLLNGSSGTGAEPGGRWEEGVFPFALIPGARSGACALQQTGLHEGTALEWNPGAFSARGRGPGGAGRLHLGRAQFPAAATMAGAALGQVGPRRPRALGLESPRGEAHFREDHSAQPVRPGAAPRHGGSAASRRGGAPGAPWDRSTELWWAVAGAGR